MSARGCISAIALLTVVAPTAALAQTWAAADVGTSGWRGAQTTTTSQLNRQASFNAAVDRQFGPALEFGTDFPPASYSAASASPENWRSAWVATTRRDIWRENDRLRLTTRGTVLRADGAPVLLTPQDHQLVDVQAVDVTYTHGFTPVRGYTASGLEVSLTPHASVGVGDRGGSVEAGATLRIGSALDRIAPDGRERFGDRSRWYLYAAGSGQAVGYNFTRTRDGNFLRSGVTNDSGSFMGDASIGVAMRKGATQTSFGLVYREIEAEGMPGGDTFDRDVSEGLVAFQLSIKP